VLAAELAASAALACLELQQRVEAATADSRVSPPQQGSTGVMLLLHPETNVVVLANVGDSRAVLCTQPQLEVAAPSSAATSHSGGTRVGVAGGDGAATAGGGGGQASAGGGVVGLALTIDHNPALAAEKARVEKAGGQVVGALTPHRYELA
jgi:hypothetical protein